MLTFLMLYEVTLLVLPPRLFMRINESVICNLVRSSNVLSYSVFFRKFDDTSRVIEFCNLSYAIFYEIFDIFL
jgi:hypothetical protein